MPRCVGAVLIGTKGGQNQRSELCPCVMRGMDGVVTSPCGGGRAKRKISELLALSATGVTREARGGRLLAAPHLGFKITSGSKKKEEEERKKES